MFENYVNYAGSKTYMKKLAGGNTFENYVNYAGSKTDFTVTNTFPGLRTM